MKLCTIHWRESTAAARVEGDRVVVLEEHADVGALLRAGGVGAAAGIEGPRSPSTRCGSRRSCSRRARSCASV